MIGQRGDIESIKYITTNILYQYKSKEACTFTSFDFHNIASL